MLEIKSLIDGVSVPSTSNELADVINPSVGEKILSIPVGSDEDVNRAVISARAAFDDGRWRDLAPSVKKKILLKLADLVDADASLLGKLDAEDMGKPITMAITNVAMATSILRYSAEAIDKLFGDTYASDTTTTVSQHWVPRGVVAAIIPWNVPSLSTLVKVAPTLAGGNSIVLKPSELSPRSALHIAKLALDAGVPPGVFNVVPGLGHTVGKALGLHNDIDMIAFTGSTVVGKLLQQYAGQSNMKAVMVECGGKSPQIVFSDGVDLDAAAEGIAQGIMMNTGQVCSAGSRLLVQQNIEEVLLKKVADRMKDYIAGDPLDAKTTLGPLVSEKQCERVLSYIATGVKEGGELMLGGERILPETGGFFVAPTIIRQVTPNATIAQEEIFGPVLSVTTFNDEAEAIALANGTNYGLAAYVWTADLARGMRLSKSIRSFVMINAILPVGEGCGHAGSLEPDGLSGVGAEGGIGGLQSYMRRKLVWFNHG